MAAHNSQIPALVADYFGSNDYRNHPIIVAEFQAGRGWTRPGFRKKVTVSWLRKLRAAGVEHVQLECDGRRADFSTAEIIRDQARRVRAARG